MGLWVLMHDILRLGEGPSEHGFRKALMAEMKNPFPPRYCFIIVDVKRYWYFEKTKTDLEAQRDRDSSRQDSWRVVGT